MRKEPSLKRLMAEVARIDADAKRTHCAHVERARKIWAMLEDTAPQTWLRVLERFMYDPENKFRCDDCPENRGNFSHNLNGQYECGQFHCWVSIHCASRGD